MGELIRSNGVKSRVRLRLVRRPSTLYDYGALSPVDAPSEFRGGPSVCVAGAEGEARGMQAKVRARCDDGRLISSPDTVISTRLQEQTRVVLAMLTPREQLVLQLRFGLAQTGDHPLEMINEVLTPAQIAYIEATALRKLRHPSQVARLRSVDRG